MPRRLLSSLRSPPAMGASPGVANAAGDYVRLQDADADCPSKLIRCWAKVALFLAAAAAAVSALLFLGPLAIKKVVAPVINRESAAFSSTDIALICFGAVAFFPSLLLLPSPFMWIAGTTFGYGYGFLLITAAMSIGMSLPFCIGSAFRNTIHAWLERWPKEAAFIRMTGEGDWFHQFRAFALLRISPFPYIVFNYASVATNVKYGPYIAGSVAGTVHETFLAIYSGKLLKSLAEATNQGFFLSVDQIICNAIGFSVAAVSTAAVTIYANKALQTLQGSEDELCRWRCIQINLSSESTHTV